MRASISSFALAALVATMVTSAAAAVIYVNAATGTNSGPCTSPAVPCKTVTYAMSQAAAGAPGDEIMVAPGTYDTALGEVFPIGVKSGVMLRSTVGAAATVLDASAAGRRVFDLVDANAQTVVEGFTITGGAPYSHLQPVPPYEPYGDMVGGGMSIQGGSPTIRKNIFLNNKAEGSYAFLGDGYEGRGGGIHVMAATPVIVSNVFRNNVARGSHAGTGHFRWVGGAGKGGAIYFEGTGGTIANNTFYSNAAIGDWGTNASGGAGESGALYANGPSVTNNIFAANSAVAGRDGVPPYQPASAAFGAMRVDNPAAPVSNNLFFGNTVNGAPSGDDTIGVNSVCTASPCAGVHFHGEPSDLHITAQSPAAGAGTPVGAPADDLDGVGRPAPPSIGAFEPSAAIDPVRLANISTRMHVLTGNDVVIGGFVISGSAPKTIVVRARGPSLAPSGLTGVLANPVLQLFSGDAVIASNDDWQLAANAAQIQASGFAPSDAAESAILITLDPGAYTAIVSGLGGSTGIAIVEAFEVDAVTTQMINISTRGRVGTGQDVMIAGFIIQGSGPQTVVIRARGPSLAQFGVADPLQDPKLELFSGQTSIAFNDNWRQAANASQLVLSGFAPPDSSESAILVALPPGAYTAIVSSADGASGTAIVEVFKN